MIFELALLAAAAAAQANAGAAAASPPGAAQSCEAHKFETQIRYTSKGVPKQSKMRMCGNVGQTDAEWIETLKDAVEKTAGNPKLPAAVKDQIITAVNGEIARLTGKAAPPAVSTDVAIAAGTGAVTALPLSTDISKLPRRGGAAPAPVRPMERDFAALPPMPTAPTAPPPRLLSTGAGGAAVLLPRPGLEIECLNSSDVAGEGPCTAFERDTLVSVRARENLPPGTAIRFVRGDARADIDVAGLTRGKLARFGLPGEVCRGVGGGKLEVQIVRSAQVVGSEGAFNLRC